MHFIAVYLQHQTSQAIFDDLSFEIGRGLERISHFFGAGVLQHYHPVFIVGIDKRNCLSGEPIKKCFFHAQIFSEGMVVVEVVVGDVCKTSCGKMQTADATLINGMRTYFHEAILTARTHHFAKQSIECNRVWRGMGCSNCLRTNLIDNRGKQTTIKTQLSE